MSHFQGAARKASWRPAFLLFLALACLRPSPTLGSSQYADNLTDSEGTGLGVQDEAPASVPSTADGGPLWNERPVKKGDVGLLPSSPLPVQETQVTAKDGSVAFEGAPAAPSRLRGGNSLLAGALFLFMYLSIYIAQYLNKKLPDGLEADPVQWVVGSGIYAGIVGLISFFSSLLERRRHKYRTTVQAITKWLSRIQYLMLLVGLVMVFLVFMPFAAKWSSDRKTDVFNIGLAILGVSLVYILGNLFEKYLAKRRTKKGER